MRISLIVAMSPSGLIGNETGLPWRLSADLKRFRQLTTGKPIIMGRTTFEHIGGPLKERLNIVLTRQPDYQSAGVVVVHSLEEAIERAQAVLPEWGGDEIMIIGGAEVYRQALPLVQRIYLTVVDGKFEGNTWFPDLETLRVELIASETIPADVKNPHEHRFLILNRDDEGGRLIDLLI